MSYPIPQKRHIIPDLPSAQEILPFLRQIDENRWYSNFGPLVCEFERRFADLMADAHRADKPANCVTMTSGYHALSIGMRLLGVGPEAKVLIPAVTFPACPLAVQNLGGEAILGDVDPVSWTLTPAIARAIAAKMKIDCVMPVSIYGMAVPADEWDAFSEETGIPVIIDAAAAIETQHYLKRGLVAHSLHALKPFGIGEGGLLVTNDADMAEKARRITNFGTVDRITYQTGENAKMSEFHAAVGMAQMLRWSSAKTRRCSRYETYKEALAPYAPLAALHPGFEGAIVSNLMVSLRGVEAEALCEALLEEGVAIHRTYLPPLYAHPHFATLRLVNAKGAGMHTSNLESQNRHMSGAALMQQSVVGLPFHPFMKTRDIHENVTLFGQTLLKLSGCDYDEQAQNSIAAFG